MSSLWTPGGEHPVDRPRPSSPGDPSPGEKQAPNPAGAGPAPGPGIPAGGGGGRAPAGGGPGPDQAPEGLADLQRQLVAAPPEVVVANHAFGLFELGALHLSQEEPDFQAARLAIDAMGALVEGLSGRLGAAETDLVEGLAQIRMAFVQVHAARTGQAN